MRKLLFTSAFVCLHIAFLHAQDWSLFPADNHSYYRNNDMIYTVTPDSNYVSGDTVFTLFQFSDTPLSASGCTNEIEDYLYAGGSLFLFPYVDYLAKVGDLTVITFGSGEYQMRFNTMCAKDDTFHLGGNLDPDLYIICNDVRIDNIFGTLDSVREFQVLHDSGYDISLENTFILSKTFGLLSFYDFNQLPYYAIASMQYFEMIGIEGPIGDKGFKPPFWKDYFPLQVSDVLIWDRHIYSHIPMYYIDYHLYFKDSVIARMDYPDSIVFYFDRWQKDTSGIITQLPTYRLRHKRSELINMLEGPTGRFKHIEVTPGCYYFQHNILKSDGLKMLFSGDDTIYSYQYFGGVYEIYDGCFVGETYDVGKSFTLQTDHGLVAGSYSVGDGNDYIVLAGGIINGESFGIVDFETVDIANDLIPTFSLFPNPASEAVNIVLPDNVSGDIRIFNTAGNCIVHAVSNIGKLTLDTSNWPSGIYMVQVVTNAGSSSQRLMKF